jgi:haloalkane dehalogenase
MSEAKPTCIEYYIPQGQGRVYAKDYPGAEPAFVLMHGLPDNSRIYDDLVPHLVAAGRRVIAFDFLGFGASDKPDHAVYDFAQQMQDLRSVVDFFGLRRVVPVVHDSSGPTGVNFVLDNTEKVDGLIVLNSPYGKADSLRWPELVEIFATKSLSALAMGIAQSAVQFAWLLNWQQEQFRLHLPEMQREHFQESVGALIEANFTQQPGAGMAFVQMTSHLNAQVLIDTERYRELEVLKVPVKIIWGMHDPYLSIGMAEELKSHIQNSSLHRLEAGHWLQSDMPRQVAQLMLDD